MGSLTFAAPVDDADRILNIQQGKMEQERRQKELEGTRFDNSEIKIDGEVKNIGMDSKKFLNHHIDLKDKDRLLSKKEKEEILEQYEYLEIGSSDIQKLMSEITNKLIYKGYTTSSVVLSESNNLSKGNLNLEIVAGRIEDIRINSGNGLDRYKEFFMFSKNKGKIFNIRDIDTATDNFSSINANNMTMEVLPEKKDNHSRVKIKNIIKNKRTCTINIALISATGYRPSAGTGGSSVGSLDDAMILRSSKTIPCSNCQDFIFGPGCWWIFICRKKICK